jgi:hypothetical protein
MSTLQSEIVVPSPSAVRWDVGGTARLRCDPPSTDAMSLSWPAAEDCSKPSAPPVTTCSSPTGTSCISRSTMPNSARTGHSATAPPNTAPADSSTNSNNSAAPSPCYPPPKPRAYGQTPAESPGFTPQLPGVARSRGPAGQPAPNRPADEVNLAPAGHVIAHVEVDGMVR